MRRFRFAPAPAAYNSMIRLRHLRFCLAASNAGSFRKAAETLRVQESAISRGVGELERRLGTNLFYRTPQGVQPTDPGQWFIRRVAAVLNDLDILEHEVRAAARADPYRVRVGLTCPLALDPMPELLARFRSLNPSCKAEFTEADHANLIEALQGDQLDVVVLSCMSVCKLRQVVFATEPLSVIGRCGLLGRDGGPVSWEKLEGFPILFDQSPLAASVKRAVRASVPKNCRLRLEVKPVQRDTLMQMVQLGDAVTIQPHSFALCLPGDLCAHPFSNTGLQLSAVWRPGQLHPALKRLMQKLHS